MRRGHSGGCRLHLRLHLLGVLGAVLVGCDTTIGPEEGPTLVRFVNAASDAAGPLQFTMSGGPSAVLQRGQGSEYTQAAAGVHAVTIEDDVPKWSVTGNLRVNQGLYQTVYAFGESGGEAAILVGDEPVTPAEGRALLRVLHLASGITGAVDLHILEVGEAVNPDAPGVFGMTFPFEAAYFFIDAAPRRIVLTISGTANILVDSGPLEFASRAIYTAVLLNDAADAAELIRLRDGA